MRWNCPHCGTVLALTTQSLGSDWFFTKCYKCLGYSMVRAPRIEFMKIDQGSRSAIEIESDFSAKVTLVSSPDAPAQAQTISQPTPNIQSAAPVNAVPKIIKAPQRIKRLDDQETLSELSYTSSTKPIELNAEEPKAEFGILLNHAETQNHTGKKTVPSPLPEIVGESSPMVSTKKEPVKKESIKTNINSELTQELIAKHRKPVSSSQYKISKTPILLASLGLIAVTMGIYILNESNRFMLSLRSKKLPIIDQLHQNAMAPIRLTPIAQPPKPEPAPLTQQSPPTSAQLETKTDKLIITSNAAAALKEAPLETLPKQQSNTIQNTKAQGLSGITVELKGDHANLRSGPSLDFPVIGSLKTGAKLRVLGWDNNWFKIHAQNESGESSQAWIRSDLVKSQ
jgi:hypothetical protein